MTESIWKREKYGYSRRDNYNVSVRDNPAENGVLIGRPHLRGWRCEVFWFVATNILAWLETSTRNHRIPHCLINRRFAAIKKFYSFFFFPKRKNCLLSILFNYFSLKKKNQSRWSIFSYILWSNFFKYNSKIETNESMALDQVAKLFTQFYQNR